MTNFFWKEIMDQFTLTLSDLENRGRGNIETLFAQANGFMGVRASLPVSDDESTPGAFVNGFYETAPIIYGENAFGYAKNHETMVKLFDFRSLELVIADEKLSKLLDQEIECDMKKGILSETYLYETTSKKQLKIHLESFTSHANRSVYAQKINLTAVNFSGRIQIDKKAKHLKPEASENRDPRVRDASRELNFSGNKISTKNSNLSLYYQFDVFSQTVELLENESFELTQIYQLSKENKFQDVEYEALKKQQIEIFEQFWKQSDLIIEGDEILQKGIRLNLYHLFNSAGRDGETNFSAKGLTGEGYEGHYFWDTEMYLLPFFTFTQAGIAKQLLTYRLSILPQALERAKELGFEGALFAWRTQSGHETSAYYPAGTAQVHINADIAYAFQLYEKVTGDEDFIKESRQLIYETARFWISYGFMGDRGFEIHEVTGPDEYTALVNNNFYTNKMAQNNLLYAVELSQRYAENLMEAQSWQEAATKMRFEINPRNQVTQQDDSFMDKEVWNFKQTPKENYPLLLHYHPMKIYKHQVLKQADTILAHMLFGENTEQMARDFDFYEPLTTHDSSLSRAIHGVVASRLGRHEQAYDFFAASATMDLSDMQGNAAHGIHAANMGGSWLGLVYGFAGLHFEKDELKFENHLPNQIKRLKFNVCYRGKTITVDFDQTSSH
ncbi:glycoside hydrolase family 65 protein [Lactococcus sp.]|uniref:glycoside hydrolase family 65 protein n=1 Tax=Lactococcus sp. TaxID=44273 RepID=UPI0035B34E22